MRLPFFASQKTSRSALSYLVIFVSLLSSAALAQQRTRLFEPSLRSGKSLFWGTAAVDADLAKSFVNTVAPNEVSMISVLDSGFDATQKSLFSGAKTLHIGKLENLNIGDPNKDENGHGTMVSSVIVGQGGLGVAEKVHFRFYRITEAGDGGTASNHTINASIERACNENRDENGVSIINVSWGSRRDEAGFERDENLEEFQALLARMTKQGCLIVKAAGNSNFRRATAFKLDDALLRAAALDPSHQLAMFSSIGEVAAPGQDILAIESTLIASKDSKIEKEISGKSNPLRFVNGTSFASPMTAAVAGQVVRVLKTKSAFVNMSPGNRIILLNRILKASETVNSINAYRAVKIADLWGKSVSQELKPSVETLKDLLSQNSDPVCKANVAACQPGALGATLAQCVPVLRAKAAICSDLSYPAALQLVRIYAQQKHYDLSFRFVEQARQSLAKDSSLRLRYGSSFEKLAMEVFEAMSGKNTDEFKKWSGRDSSRRFALSATNPNILVYEFANYMNNCERLKSCNKKFLAEFFISMLVNDEVQAQIAIGKDLKTGEDRGSEAFAIKVTETFYKALGILGELELNRIINVMIEEDFYWLKNHRDWEVEYEKKERASGKFIEPTYHNQILAADLHLSQAVLAAAQDPTDSKKSRLPVTLAESLKNIEQRCLAEVLLGNYNFRADTAKYAVVEVYPVRSIYFNSLDKLSKYSLDQINKLEISKLKPVEVQYIIHRNLERPLLTGLALSDAQLKLWVSLFQLFSEGTSWGTVVDKEILTQILELMGQKALSYENKIQISEELPTLIGSLSKIEYANLLIEEVLKTNHDEKTSYPWLNAKVKLSMIELWITRLEQSSDAELVTAAGRSTMIFTRLIDYLFKRSDLAFQLFHNYGNKTPELEAKRDLNIRYWNFMFRLVGLMPNKIENLFSFDLSLREFSSLGHYNTPKDRLAARDFFLGAGQSWRPTLKDLRRRLDSGLSSVKDPSDRKDYREISEDIGNLLGVQLKEEYEAEKRKKK